MKRLGLAAALLVLATVPFWVGNTYYINIASQVLLYAVFALGLNVLVGYAGLVSLGEHSWVARSHFQVVSPTLKRIALALSTNSRLSNGSRSA